MKANNIRFTQLASILLLTIWPSIFHAQNTTPTKPDKVVYLIDVSKSMIGEGSIETYNVFQSSKDELAKAFETLPDSLEVVIIPFAESTHTPIRLSSQDRDSLKSYITALHPTGKYTDLIAAYKKALGEIDTSKTTSVFFITDGHHNYRSDTNALFSYLNEYPTSRKASSCILHYFLTDSQYREMTICNIFNGNDRMELIESLAFSIENEDTSSYNQITSNVTASDNYNNNSILNCSRKLGWLWIFLILLLAAIIIYALIRYAIPNVSSISLPTLGASMQTVDSNKNDNIPNNVKDSITKLNKNNGNDNWMSEQHMHTEKLSNGDTKITSGHEATTITVAGNGTIYAPAGSYTQNGKVYGDLNAFLQQDNLATNANYIVDEHTKYQTDSLCRTVYNDCHVSELHKQNIAEGKTRNVMRHTGTQSFVRTHGLSGDESSHLVPRELGGANESINQVPWNGPDQRPGGKEGSYGWVEKKVVDAVHQGHDVRIVQKLFYKGNEFRPFKILYTVIIDGVSKTYEIFNPPCGE